MPLIRSNREKIPRNEFCPPGKFQRRQVIGNFRITLVPDMGKEQHEFIRKGRKHVDALDKMYLAPIKSNDTCLTPRFKQYKIRTIEIASKSFGTDLDLYLLPQLSILHDLISDRIKCILQTWGSIATEIQRASDMYLEFIYVPRSSLENVVTDVFHEHSAWLDSSVIIRPCLREE